MAGVIGIKVSKKARIMSLGIIFLVITIIVTLKVLATSSINVIYSYKSIDENYIVCQVEDSEYGILKVTNMDEDKELDIELDIDPNTHGQMTPLTIKYNLKNQETAFKVWNTKDKYKVIRMSDISLNISHAAMNYNGSVISLVANNEDGTINKIEYPNGNLIKSYDNASSIYESIRLGRSGTTSIKLTTSNSNNAIVVDLIKDTIPPQQVHIYKNSRGEVALTAQSSSGIWEITDELGATVYKPSKFERYGTYVFPTTVRNLVIKNGVGTTTTVTVPDAPVPDNTLDINISYEPQGFVIDAKDMFGLWKVVDIATNDTIHEYKDEPIGDTFEVSRELLLPGVRVYNMAGNYKDVMFDKDAPEILWAYVNHSQNTVVACIQDNDSGLRCVKDTKGNTKVTFNNQENKATFEYYIEDKVSKLKIYDYENNVATLDLASIKFNIDNAYRNIDGDKLSIVANTLDEGNKLSKLTYMDDTVIDIIDDVSVDKVYNLVHDGTVKVKLYDNTGGYVVIVLDYEEDDAPKVTKFVKSERNHKMLIKAYDNESGLDRITYLDDTNIVKFDKYTKDVDEVYSINANTESVLVWDRIGNWIQLDFVNNIDEEGPEIIDKIHYDDNGDDYTIALRDTGSGLCTINKLEENELLYDFAKDGYPEVGTYKGKISVDGNEVKIYDRLGNLTFSKVDGKGPRVLSCKPLGDNPKDWVMIAVDQDVGLSKITYENGDLVRELTNSTIEETIEFTVVQGTSAVLVYDTEENVTRVELDKTVPEILDVSPTIEVSDQERAIEVFSLAPTLDTTRWRVRARDIGSGLKSIRTSPDGEDIALFKGNTRSKETIDINLPKTVTELYAVDWDGNVSVPYKLNRNEGLEIVVDSIIKGTTCQGLVIIDDGVDDNNIIDVKLYNDDGNAIQINKNPNTGAIGNIPGIYVAEGTTARLLLGNEDVYIYGGYTGGGARITDASYIHYPGICVPEGAKLIIEQRPEGGNGTLYVYGNDYTSYGNGDGGAAAIGGYGVVEAGRGKTARGQSSGEIEIISGKIVATAGHDTGGFGTGAGIGGGGACAWNGSAVAGSGSRNNIIIHEEANVITNTYGAKGVGAKIGDGGKYDSNSRRGGSGGYAAVSYTEIPTVEVSHTPDGESDKVKIVVKAHTNSGLYKISLDGEEKIFDDCPTGDVTWEFIVNENRVYKIVVTDKDGLFTTVTHKIDNVVNITEPEEPEEENAALIQVSESTDKGINITRDCTIIFDNDKDIIINKGYRTNENGTSGISIKDGVSVKIIQAGIGNVAIYGGYKEDISYPGIMVPEKAKLEIYGVTPAKMYVFGYGRSVNEDNVIVGGSGAGIGGYGHCSVSGDAKAQDCGSVKIVSGNVEAYGGIIEVANGTSCGTGAGIGGGGAYSVMGMATAGKVKGTIIDCVGNIKAYGGESKRAQGAKIGSGGAATVEGVNIKGQSARVDRDYIEVDKDTVITNTTNKGYRITRDCKLIFRNDNDVIIGSTKIGCAGISVADGVQATVSIEGLGNVAVYGGFSGIKSQENRYYVTYPGIEVPKTAQLTIDNNTAQSLTVYGGGVDELPVSAAAIGTRGIYTSGKIAQGQDVGNIIINKGTLNVIPKHVVNFGEKGAIGAGIGVGGIMALDRDAKVVQGRLDKDNLKIADVCNVLIRARDTVKIGVGNIIKGEVITQGEERMYDTIDTIGPDANIMRCDDGALGYATIKIGARDTTSGLSKVVLEDGSVYRFKKFGQGAGVVSFNWHKNGVLNARVYDVAGNYTDIAYLVEGLVVSEQHPIDIQYDKSVIKNINDGEYIKVVFKKQPSDVNMYVRVDNQLERLVNRGSDEYVYNLQILDNCIVTARIESVDTKKTLWEEMCEVTNLVRVSTNRVVDKDSTSVRAEGMLQELYKEDYVKDNIKKIGFMYTIVGGNGKVYDVSCDNLDEAMIDEASMRYRLTLNKLKPATRYKIQTYIVNKQDEVIKGEEGYFVTRSKGEGLTSRYYEVGNNIPAFIKQSKGLSPSTGISTLSPIRNKYGDVVINRVDKSKMEWVGEIVPVNNRTIWFKIESNKDLTIKIDQEEFYVNKGESYINTKNIYLEGKKYPFKMMLEGDTAGEVNIKVSWLEDGVYQEIPRSQFYPKEYMKIESVLVDKGGKIRQEIDGRTGKLVNKKVLSNGISVKKLDIANNKVVLANGAILKLGSQVEVEGNIIMKQEGKILPIIDNVCMINYDNGDVMLSDGTNVKLYQDVDVIGCVHKINSNESYDLCKYIQRIIGNKIVMSDESKLTLGKEVELIDGHYILNLYSNDYDTKEYQELMNDYATTNRLVREMRTTNVDALCVGETKMFDIMPVKILLSFEEDDVFMMKDPVLEIDGKLTKCAGVVGDDLCLDLPDASVYKGEYGSFSYMNDTRGEYNYEGNLQNNATVEKMRNGNIKVVLDGYSRKISKLNDKREKNVMLNLMLSVSSSGDVTREEIIERVKNMTVYTKIKVKEITIANRQTKLDVQDAVLPIKLKK